MKTARLQVRFHLPRLDHWSAWTDADADTRRALQPGDWAELRRGETVMQQGGLYEIRLTAPDTRPLARQVATTAETNDLSLAS